MGDPGPKTHVTDSRSAPTLGNDILSVNIGVYLGCASGAGRTSLGQDKSHSEDRLVSTGMLTLPQSLPATGQRGFYQLSEVLGRVWFLQKTRHARRLETARSLGFAETAGEEDWYIRPDAPQLS